MFDEHLACEARPLPRSARARQDMLSLKVLLFGAPLYERGDGDLNILVEELNACLRGVIELLSAEVGPCLPMDQAKLEWGRIISMNADFSGVAARRAALIFAFHTMEGVRLHFAVHEPELVRDLEQRVLPIVVPAFLAGMAQKPEALVILTSTLSEMWVGEQMGVGIGNATPTAVASAHV